MIFYEKIKEMSFDEMCAFILQQIHSDCHGAYDADCKEEGYINCYDCVSQMLNREVK
jgi:hypothetical protein